MKVRRVGHAWAQPQRYASLVFALMMCVLSMAAAGQELIGYLPDWSEAAWTPTEAMGVTEVILFSAEVRADGTLDAARIDEAVLAKAAEAREVLGCRVTLAVGGWERDEHFPAMVADAARRAAFVEAVVAYLAAHELDGVDLDWEYPRGAEQVVGFVALLVELDGALAERGGTLTVAVPAWLDLTAAGYAAVDRVHLMSYDHAYPQATFDRAVADVERQVGFGCSPGKLALGVPLYGRDAERQSRSYRDLVARLDAPPGAGVDAVEGYAFNGPATLERKARWAVERGLAGVMVWALPQDTAEPVLLPAIARGLRARATATAGTGPAGGGPQALGGE